MNTNLDKNKVTLYKSQSQQIRISSELWVENQGYCPNCGIEINRYPANKPVADFYCRKCNEDFELKSKKYSFGTKIVDGAYQTMINRLKDIRNPNLFLMNYNPISYKVINFLVIPKQFFIPKIIEKRKALSPLARRAGWIGCNILLGEIPEAGRIFIVKNKHIEPKEKVRKLWARTLFLREEKGLEAKGWIIDIMHCIELLKKDEFSLSDIYKFEPILSKQYPKNRHIKDKIRQQLQILRDRNYLIFSGRGQYRLSKY